MLGFGNPKTIIWFITLLPQFIDATGNVLSQTLVIGVVGAIIDMVVQWMYTHLGGSLSRFLAQPVIRKWFERGVGIVFIVLALLVTFGLRQHV